MEYSMGLVAILEGQALGRETSAMYGSLEAITARWSGRSLAHTPVNSLYAVYHHT